jgi:N-acetylglucosamine-6-phosphate deacetylase
MSTLEKSTLNSLTVHVAESRRAMGAHAAADIAREIRACLGKQPGVRMVFAAAPSQSEMLAALREQKGIDWSRVTAFHMDEYLGLPADAPQRFGLWLRRAIFDYLPFAAVHLIEPGDNPEQTAADYAANLNAAPIDIVCCGIGSNGHLAFNDPPADFEDPLTVKAVELDRQCRQQQVDEECFATLSDVPTRALTITIPGLLAGHALFCTVPGTFKREAVRRTLSDPIDPMCPATALRQHPRCTLYLDLDSADEVRCDESGSVLPGVFRGEPVVDAKNPREGGERQLSRSLSERSMDPLMSHSLSGRDPRTGKALVVRFADGRITSVEAGASTETAWLAPGLIDLQVNGYHGDDFNGDDLLTMETVQRLARRMLATGVTTFLPTLTTAPEEKIIHNLRIIAAARLADPLLTNMIPYVHVEGPHIAPEDGPRGAHPREYVRPPDIAEFMRWQAASGDLVGMVTLSPQYVNAPEYIHALSARGIHISLGHTGASGDQIRSAVAAGARLSTHLGNGVANLLPRHPNPIWAQLAEDRLTATFIADGHHLPADTLTAMLRAKTVQRAILVTDIVTFAGLPPGEYMTPLGGRVDLHPNGRLNVADSGYLAGATATLKDDIAFVAANTGFSIGDAVQMATANPGRFVGARGVLRVGASADLIRFHWEQGSCTLTIKDAIVQGKNWQ